MPRFAMGESESIEVLGRGRVLRVAFHDGPAVYLLPLGYVRVGTALYGVADRGRKTRLAEANPGVAFQVDTSSETGLWEWRSVTGRGSFEIVTDEAERRAALAALQPIIAEAPAWWRAEQAPQIAAGSLVVWRIRPTELSGCRYGKAED